VDVSIRSILPVEHPLQRTQHAYRTGRSTDTALYHLKSLIEDSLTHKEVAVCAFLDIQGAFDNTSHEAVNASLSRRGLDAKTSRWIKSLLASRRAMATIGGQSSTVSTTRGCPQGGILSPLLWSLLVDELLHILSLKKVFDKLRSANLKLHVDKCEFLKKETEFLGHIITTDGIKPNPNKINVIIIFLFLKLQKEYNLSLDSANSTVSSYRILQK